MFVKGGTAEQASVFIFLQVAGHTSSVCGLKPRLQRAASPKNNYSPKLSTVIQKLHIMFATYVYKKQQSLEG